MNAQCLNNPGSYSCICKTGYFGSGEECAEGQCHDDSCPVNQKCISPTSWDCECPKSYKLVNNSCIDVDECFENLFDCPTTSECVNNDGSYECICFDGYENELCTNIDECSTGQHHCKDLLNCHDTIGTYECQCKDGYQFDTNYECRDIDECLVNPEVCGKKSCHNVIGSFVCKEPRLIL